MTEDATRADGSPTTPARRYSWPPFEPGHELSLKHGAYSPRRLDPLVNELVDQVLADPDTAYLSGFRPALYSWARAEARVQLLEEWLADHQSIGVDDSGETLSVLNQLRLWHVRASNQLSRLGLDPTAAARLGRDRAAAQVDIARVMAELERRDRERNAGGTTVDGEVEP